MNLTPSTVREVRRLALDVVLLDGEQDAAPDLSDMARRAKALIDGPLRDRKRIPRPRAPGKDRDARRAEHRASTGELREAVWERCGGVVIIGSDESGNDVTFFEGRGRCEVSGVDLGTAWEMHHLDGGGNRRSQQSLDNVLAVSWEVHRLIHRGDMPTLRSVKEACIRLGLREGLRAIEHRIAKVEEARR